ncbi:hypothetical protein LGAS_1112 [Lactobacillus gasseri ATCC 33323 = JCM 1131]|uniref:Uncharacterized protein n=1 Tax=Lactobacillus gasseri (strain ATCC 33323 / DSM 20243 / BCRC 14619 / CIP 102991 / JCM 1131 / KCTC 3163 / NCIMB 11718 / NCTC 13722 / AM63) TaxID=324831 RepID=A0A805Z0S0_LACGA|nr:hypothetical protein LGAS_1112 [Lactobacillus gasseri ATCC 33323 = JCM 1131]
MQQLILQGLSLYKYLNLRNPLIGLNDLGDVTSAKL